MTTETIFIPAGSWWVRFTTPMVPASGIVTVRTSRDEVIAVSGASESKFSSAECIVRFTEDEELSFHPFGEGSCIQLTRLT